MTSGLRLLRSASESLEPPVANDGVNFVSQRGFQWPLWRFWLQRSSEHAASAKRCCDSNSCVGKWPESPQLGHYLDFGERPVLVKPAVEVLTCLKVQNVKRGAAHIAVNAL